MSAGRTAALAEALRGQIVSGGIGVGEKLPSEAALIAEHGVSRTVVREALSRLQADGLIRTRRGSGSYALTPPTRATTAPEEADDAALARTPAERQALLEYRIAVETEAAALAARRRDAGRLRLLSAALAGLAAAGDHPADAVEHDFTFHRELAAAAANPHLLRAVEALGPAMIAMPAPRLARGGSGARTAGDAAADAARNTAAETAGDAAADDAAVRHRQVVAEHRAVLDAVAEQDPQAAAAAMRAHLAASRRRLLGEQDDEADIAAL
ncbi:FadR/GntR family transcriptional regulator [Nesterenkonia halophila]|uniref:FadR/GntR family transcriptional regulator n=1 Tax=Nesterenkonia halophila TaxID=302044 RepID=UPI001290EEB2|nr:FCD domain-containing protein [Nesterenkonia halophila]